MNTEALFQQPNYGDLLSGAPNVSDASGRHRQARPRRRQGLRCCLQWQQSDHPNGTSGGIRFTITSSYTCSGTYKGGAFPYTEMTTSYQIVYATGLRYQAKTPCIN